MPIRLLCTALLTLFFAMVVLLPRLWSPATILTVDEQLWIDRGHQFMYGLGSGDFLKTFVAGQPGVTTAGLIGLTVPWGSLAAGQIAIGVTTSLLILTITYLISRSWGIYGGLLTGFLLGLDPFLLAHSRIAHTDALFALFALLSLAALLAASPRGKPLVRRYFVLSAVAAGLALLTKVFGLITIILDIITIAYLIGSPREYKRLLTLLASWLLLVGITVVMLWPALWVNPTTVISYLAGRSVSHVEGTDPGAVTAQWWYYPREFLFRATPFTLLLLLAGVFTSYYQRRHDSWRDFWLLVFHGAFFAMLMSAGSDKGDRYVLYTAVTAVLAAGFALNKLTIQSKVLWRFVVPVFIIASLGASAWRLHPYYLAYYNPLYPVEAQHKLGWGEGLEQAARWIAEQNSTAHVASYYARVFESFYPTGDVESLTHRENVDFVVLYRGMYERGPVAIETDILREFFTPPSSLPVHTIYLNDLPYVWIFKTGGKS